MDKTGLATTSRGIVRLRIAANAMKKTLKKAKTDLAVILGDMTSQLQPLDVAINKAFKDRLNKHYTDWLTG